MILILFVEFNLVLVIEFVFLMKEYLGNMEFYFKVMDMEGKMYVDLIFCFVKFLVGRELIFYLKECFEFVFYIN